MRQKEISKVLEAFVAIGPAAVEPLMALLKDPNPAVRALAAQALGKIGPKSEEAIPELQEVTPGHYVACLQT